MSNKINEMDDMKREYYDVEIPKELSQRINTEIKKAEHREKTKTRKNKTNNIVKWSVAAAALVGLFTLGLNTSEAFAMEMSEIPVVGNVAQVLTFRSYETKAEDLKISVSIPSIEMMEADFKELESSLNEEILDMCQNYVDKAKVHAEEYKEAFLETGGTEEEWLKHNLSIDVWYEVKTQTEQYMSLAIIGTENWNSANTEIDFFNVDLQSGTQITLKDVLGENHKDIVDDSIMTQIQGKWATGENNYWLDNWKGINENTRFYMNQKGNPVVVLQKYEITTGTKGEPEFEIFINTELTEQNVILYEDNFDVDNIAVVEYANAIKDAVSNQDLEQLADLMNFPVYVDLNGGQVVNTREDFIALGAEIIFTDAIVESITNANVDSLNPSMAGFSLSDGSSANILFTVQSGQLKIVGINY